MAAWIIGAVVVILLLCLPLVRRSYRRGELFGRYGWRHGDEKRIRTSRRGIQHGSEAARVLPPDNNHPGGPLG